MDKNERDNQYDQDDFYDDEVYEERPGIGKKLVGVIISLVLLVILIAAGLILYNQQLQPVNPENTENLYVDIPSGLSTKEVSQILEDNDLIRNSLVFTSYAGRHSYGGAEIQAATYELNQSMGVPEIFTKLVNGDSYVGQITNVTIPEGKNINEQAQIVQDAGICTIDDFIAEAKIADRTLEGYLFPDTYNVVGTGPAGAQNLIDNQLTRLTEVYTPEMIQETQDSGRTVDDVIILASVVELETKLPEDRPDAASVFLNRIAQNMPLQSDITIDYINGTRTDVLTTDQTQVQSPYNTYLNLGLPYGPICSPGIASIEACVNPNDTNYLYFVADMTSGKLHFNETYEGHMQDVQTYMGQ